MYVFSALQRCCISFHSVNERAYLPHNLCQYCHWAVFSSCLLCVRVLYYVIGVLSEWNRYSPCFPGIYSLAVETDIEQLCLQIFNYSSSKYDKGAILKTGNTYQEELEVNFSKPYYWKLLSVIKSFSPTATLVK